MKNLLIVKAILLSFLMVFLMTPMVMADTVTITRVNGYYSGNGGEFTIQITGSSTPDLNWVLPLYDPAAKGKGGYTDSFQTFCVETNEFINIGGTYDFSISNRAYLGGVGTAGDPISVGTAWLYHEFQLGRLQGYDYTPGNGRKADAGALQNTIWWLEEEITTKPINEFTTLVEAMFPDDPTIPGLEVKADNAGKYPVAVLNLWAPGHVFDFEKDAQGNYKWVKQDQLVCVPEPATMFLLGSGLLGLAAFARRKFRT